MPSLHARFMNLVFKLMPQETGEKRYEAERARNARRRTPRVPAGVRVDPIDLNGIQAEKISKQGNNDFTIMYIHGGGFTTGSARERRAITFYLADKLGYNCIANDYRLAPEHKYPAALEDCYTAYLALLEQGYHPDKIILMGESAGGTLVLALPLLLKQKKKPLPGLIASFSPVTTIADDLPSHKQNIATDYMLKQDICDMKQLDAYIGRERLTEAYKKDPLVSPLYGDYEGLPPVFLATTDYEVMYDDAICLYQKLAKSGHDVCLDVKHGVCHAYPVLVSMPEAKQTLKAFHDFAAERL